MCVSDVRSITYQNGFSNPPTGVFGSAKVNIGESVCNPVIYGMRWGSETISTPDWFWGPRKICWAQHRAEHLTPHLPSILTAWTMEECWSPGYLKSFLPYEKESKWKMWLGSYSELSLPLSYPFSQPGFLYLSSTKQEDHCTVSDRLPPPPPPTPMRMRLGSSKRDGVERNLPHWHLGNKGLDGTKTRITLTAPFPLFAFLPHPTVLTKRYSCHQRRRKANSFMSEEHPRPQS